MPPLETTGLVQKAVLLRAVGRDNYGRVTVSAAEEISVRWVEKQQEGVDPLGSPITYDATAIVDQAVAVDSILWEGKLADFPVSPTGLFQVRGAEATPCMKNRNVFRMLSLLRYSDSLPTIV